jgi:hypothetical protein
MAVVLIKKKSAIGAGIDSNLQGRIHVFLGVLLDRTDRENGAGVNIKGLGFQIASADQFTPAVEGWPVQKSYQAPRGR